jgi:signal peptidase II
MKSSRFFGIIVIIFIVDQLTKLWFHTQMELYDSISLFPGANFTLAYNEGAAFSFLAGQDGWQRWFFVILALAVCGFLLQLRKEYPDQVVPQWALAFIIAGAIGNGVDRLWLGKVIDFIHVYTFWLEPVKHFPIFNIADIAITIGAVLLVIQMLVLDRKKPAI